MNEFKRINNLVGWALFLISLAVYTITMEETASFWDCGEFIAVSYKLMVPHPPGAPFFLLINRLFSFLAFGDVLKVAWWINFQSAFMSALTIMFLYWTIVMLGMKIIKPSQVEVEGKYKKSSKKDYTLRDKILLFGSAAVGALAYTFSDTFWFSAVEAEVYAMSSAITALVFWAILKWELIEDHAASNRWLIMIAYIIGLSIGVHLENLLCLPALAMIYYYKKYPNTISIKGTIIAMGVGGAIILGVIIIVIPGLPSIAFVFDKFFVNGMGMSFGSGGLFFFFALVASLVYGIVYTHHRAMVTLNNVLLGTAFILIGYMSYTLVLVRSNQFTPINENAPDDLLGYVSYLKREQYGDRPLFYGPTYDAQHTGTKKDGDKYREANANGKDYYEVYDHKTKAEYASKDMMLFPRLYSKTGHHPQLYREWAGIEAGKKPTFANNLYYFFRYQIGHMYLRYFMWNFAGRESDEKDAGYAKPWDDMQDLPELVEKNKARTNFYFLPLILGLLGVFYHYKRDQKNFWVVMIVFLTLGVALVVYLNSPPVEPRERDYIYAASFYAFAIWIGFGALALAEFLSEKANANGAIAGIALSMVVPVLMGANGWSGHNRSNRFHSVDQARNTLASCAPNAILFTGGDNDTFPLWYVQNVEEFRTDVRVAVLSYFSTGWYLDQMKQKQYESEPLPLSISSHNYREGKNDYVPLVEDERAANGVNLKAYLASVEANNPVTQVGLQGGQTTAKLLSRVFILDVDSAAVVKSGIIPKGMEGRVKPKMAWRLKSDKTYIFKNELALLDLIATNNWERPIYFNNTSANTINMDLRGYLFLEGMTYRLLPIQANTFGEVGEVNTEVMLENIEKFAFRGMQDESVYYDDEYRKFGANTRNNVYRLSEKLYIDGLVKNDEAKLKLSKEKLDWILAMLPDATIPYSFYSPKYMELYYKLGAVDEANAIYDILIRRSEENVNYYAKTGKGTESVARRSLIVLQQLAQIFEQNLKLVNDTLSERENSEVDPLTGKVINEVPSYSENITADLFYRNLTTEQLKQLQQIFKDDATQSRAVFQSAYENMMGSR
ncbi:glycosyltransferase family 117 protein [Flammeovirga aprica]|uniref:DUF2723 domain-containing protein n=1 Tax=Flammeovirga aprica JL-4 TaxID=694437 RepID=A0A7X9P083_9BACT|nr:DUF2723 domain-containing protein [Flammeovirga aprica]NME67164.1 DUF2723 domain-containing protein [Flammeovirga aprica JL-4]